MLTLYYYEHCPYCVRVLAILGMANIDFKPVVLLNDDEATPIGMIGQKMLPILQTAPETYLAESLDIIDYIADNYDVPLQQNSDWEAQVDAFFAANRDANYGLTMPRWTKAPLKEFATQSAIDYFTRKKTQTIGDFDAALAKTPDFIRDFHQSLVANTALFEVLNANPNSKAAIMLFSGLYGLRYVEDFDWTPASQGFMQTLSASTHLPL